MLSFLVAAEQVEIYGNYDDRLEHEHVRQGLGQRVSALRSVRGLRDKLELILARLVLERRR